MNTVLNASRLGERLAEGRTETSGSMSNFDHTIDEGVEEALRSGKHYCQHAAWNFCGYVWHDGTEFVEEVWVYGAPVAEHRNTDLRELMRAVNAEHGSE